LNRRALRFGAIIGAATVSTLAVAPAFAAATVSQSSSNALTLSIAGSPVSTGTVKATNDGTTETVTGETQPLIGALGNQNLIDAGVLVQEATAQVDGGAGVSAACGGLAGPGSSAIEIGESTCIEPGQNLGVTLGNLDLTGVTTLNPNSLITGALSGLNQLLDPLLGQITQPLSDALSDALGGATGITASLDAVQAVCNAAPGTASGSASIANAKLSIDLAGTQVDLLNLPANPPANTELVADLGTVVNTILDGVETDLNTTLDGALNGLSPVIDQLQTQIVDAIVTPLGQALAPLTDQIIKVTLNKQVKSTDTIAVTALDLELLPALADFIDGPLVGLQIGQVTCGPNGTVVNPPTDNPTDGTEGPNVPAVVDSGVAGNGDNTARNILIATSALMLLAGSAGLIGYRRSLLQ